MALQSPLAISLPIAQDDEDKSSPLKNCIRNNYRHMRKKAKKEVRNCFRIYDRDIKEYPIAIDFYAERFCIHHFSFSRESNEPKEQLVQEVESALSSLFGASRSSIYWRVRVKREKMEQYEKNCDAKEFFPVVEHGIRFLVNLTDYLDTGLFLDHRETRKYVSSIAQGKRILNLFSYTCSFSVYAALAGAISTKSVDLSNTYLAWGKENFLLNKIPLKNHSIVRADCLKFLASEERAYDIIIIDPPTISRSKKMDQMLDVQVDYIFLISSALRILDRNGLILFSTNSRRFCFDASQFPSCRVVEISKQTHPIDFRDPKIRRCWVVSPV